MGESFGPPPRAVRLDRDLIASAEPALRDLIAPLLGHAGPVTDQAITTNSGETVQ